MNQVCDTAVTSASDPQADFRRPDAVSRVFLDQPQRAAYFHTLTDSNLGNAAFTNIAEQHLCRVIKGAGRPSENWHDAPAFIGPGSYVIAECENHRRVGNTDIGEHGLLHPVRDLRKYSGSWQIFSLMTACTSPARVLIQVDNCLRGGAEHAFVLGIKDPNCLTLLHFHGLGLFTERYRPFGGNGLILGEGVAALALPATPPDCIGRLKLVGHITSTGNDLVQNNNKALEQIIRRISDAVTVLPEDIATVKAHGVGTTDDDAVELAALENMLGALPPLMTFKVQIGRALGTTTALETALLLSALKQGDDIDYQGYEIRFSDDVFCLANHSGFGGNNTAMVWQ